MKSSVNCINYTDGYRQSGSADDNPDGVNGVVDVSKSRSVLCFVKSTRYLGIIIVLLQSNFVAAEWISWYYPSFHKAHRHLLSSSL